MKLKEIKALLDSELTSMEVGQILVNQGFSKSISNARRVAPILRRLLAESASIPESVVTETENGVKGKQIEQNFRDGTAKEMFTVENPPTSLDDFIEHFETDLKVWEPYSWRANHWAGRYQIKVDFRLRDGNAERIRELVEELKAGFKRAKTVKTKGSGVGVIGMADFHYGMKYDGDQKNPAFNIDALTQSIRNAADKINSKGLEEVHLVLAGDFIESFTGLNHMDAWKHLESYGRDAVIGVARLLVDELILRINNVAHVYIVPGNHDRVTPKKDLDSRGEAARLIADFLELMVDVPVSFDYLILNPIIDGIRYIITHGHLGVSKMEASTMILEYGSPDIYNVIINAHGHHLLLKKGVKYRKDYETNVVTLEGSNYIKIQLAPMVTGGAYSASIGGQSQSGFSKFQNNGNGRLDYSCYAA